MSSDSNGVTRLSLPPDRLAIFDNPGGLTSQEALASRDRYGDNLIVEARRRTWRQRFKDIAADPMLWFLLAMSVTYLVLGDTTEAIILVLAILPLTWMDAFLHHRTQASTAGLESRIAAFANVIRDGHEGRLTAREVVVGDLLVLRAGELVAADGLFQETKDLQIEESSLTGEAYAVHKAALPMGTKTHIVNSTHWGLAGTRALSGEGLLRVVNTGRDTLYGQIVRTADARGVGPTPLQSAINRLVLILSVAAVALCVVLAVVRVTQGHGWVDALVSAATLAVAALPEEYPVVFTFFLAAGVSRLARRHALVRRAVCVENIGRVTTICADKTGTLTQGALAVATLIPTEKFTREQMLAIALGASRKEGGDPLDVAIFTEAEREHVAQPAGHRVRVFPFTEQRRRETCVWANAALCTVTTKGTPEVILGMCALTNQQRDAWLERVAAAAADGSKTIACARVVLPLEKLPDIEPSEGFEFAGLVICNDPVRPGVLEAIRSCQNAGIHTIMITGDHPKTGRAVARAIGLGGAAPRVILGDELSGLLASRDAIESIDVVARALPAQKLALVRALQAHGHSVLATGDGVNDVPALQAADVGIAMGERGTQSAREAATVVLLDDNFRTIVGAIAEGRNLFENLRASFRYLLFVHVPLVLTAALVPLAGYPLLYLPIHIVLIELIIHPTALVAFQSSTSGDVLHDIQQSGRPHFFSVRDWLVLLTSGIITTFVIVVGYLHGLGELGSAEYGRTIALVILTTASALAAAIFSRLRGRGAQIIFLTTLIAPLTLLQVPSLARLIHAEPLRIDDLLCAIGGGIAAIVPLLVDRLFEKRSQTRRLQQPMPREQQ